VVDGLKALDSKRPIREADNANRTKRRSGHRTKRRRSHRRHRR